MAGVRKKGPTWYVKWRDSAGRVQEIATKVATRAEAKGLGRELEMQAERQRLGLEFRPPPMTFDALAGLWLEKHSGPRLRSHDSNEGRLRLHLRPTLGKLLLTQVTPLMLDSLFTSKLEDLSVQSVVHLRNTVRKMFNDARRWRLWVGENPATQVSLPKIVRRPPTFVPAVDVPRILASAEGEFRPFAAVAIYSGLREGEVLELRPTDLDLGLRLIVAQRTIGNETNKGKKPRYVPIVGELMPYLVALLAERASAGPGAYLFPQMRQWKGSGVRVYVARRLKETLVRAGMVERWDHICRRKSCRKIERHPDGEQRRCSVCNYMLWPRPITTPLTFHGLRHTYVSHLLMKGAQPIAVQRMAGHATLEMTLEGYGHLVPDFLRAEAERLTFAAETKLLEARRPGGDSKEVSGERVDKKPEE